MPTHESQLPRMPVLPWQRPPVSRNPKGQFRPGASGNPRGRPTNARLAAKRAALGDLAILKRAASYEGMTPGLFVRVARTAYGKSWQGPTREGHHDEPSRTHSMVPRHLQNIARAGAGGPVCLSPTCSYRPRLRPRNVPRRYRRQAGQGKTGSITASQIADPPGGTPEGILKHATAPLLVENGAIPSSYKLFLKLF